MYVVVYLPTNVFDEIQLRLDYITWSSRTLNPLVSFFCNIYVKVFSTKGYFPNNAFDNIQNNKDVNIVSLLEMEGLSPLTVEIHKRG